MRTEKSSTILRVLQSTRKRSHQSSRSSMISTVWMTLLLHCLLLSRHKIYTHWNLSSVITNLICCVGLRPLVGCLLANGINCRSNAGSPAESGREDETDVCDKHKTSSNAASVVIWSRILHSADPSSDDSAGHCSATLHQADPAEDCHRRSRVSPEKGSLHHP